METSDVVGLRLVPDELWVRLPREMRSLLDPSLRRVGTIIEALREMRSLPDPSLLRFGALIEATLLGEFYRRTGISLSETDIENGLQPTVELPLLLELNVKDGKFFNPPENLKIPKAYFDERSRYNNLTHVTARLVLDAEKLCNDPDYLPAQIANTLGGTGIKRWSLAAPLQPCLEESLENIGMPANGMHQGIPADGEGIVVGIIDDGCALAHLDFLNPLANGASGLESRVQFLWDQSATSTPPTVDWTQPSGFEYGFELRKVAIDRVLARPGHVRTVAVGSEEVHYVDSDKIYNDLGYQIAGLASHGTHVMSIAAGNGQSLMGSPGVARKADIVFVQLPKSAIESGGPTLSSHILDGVMYIFERARLMNKPAVVNISYGGYTGPHDGTTELESGMDQMLAVPDRTVVVAAGNGFEADCHAQGIIGVGEDPVTLQWVLRPEDPTANYLEVWYNGSTSLNLRLTPPGADAALGPIPLDSQINIQRLSDLQHIGTIDHAKYSGNGDNRITIILASTIGEDSVSNVAAPSGIWKVELGNTGSTSAEFHAWIERDATGGRGSVRRQQSHFVAEEANPGCTLGGLATGHHTIAVGAYNTATQEICRYSAAGPTRAIGGNPGTIRRKPEVCAPAEQDPAGRGTLSASSGRSQPTRMNGTSASAPHVTGLVALMYQYIREAGRPALSASAIRAKVMQAALVSPPLNLNRHQQADDTRPHKQNLYRAELTGNGMINVQATLDLL